MTEWSSRVLHGTPWLNTVQQQILRALPKSQWPGLQQLNRALRPYHRSGSGHALRFVEQDRPLSALAYEQTIYDSGQVPTRSNDWHDLLNALMWLSWPRSKATLNAAHVADPEQSENRSRRRDLLTLLDECGVIIAITDAEVARLNREHHWHALFIHGRRQWHDTIIPTLLGHGLAQQLMTPYVGLTGKALYVVVPRAFTAWSPQRQQDDLDRRLAGQINRHPALNTPACLLPLPVLGVPGWYEANQEPSFYDQTRYFRPKAVSTDEPHATGRTNYAHW